MERRSSREQATKHSAFGTHFLNGRAAKRAAKADSTMGVSSGNTRLWHFTHHHPRTISAAHTILYRTIQPKNARNSQLYPTVSHSSSFPNSLFFFPQSPHLDLCSAFFPPFFFFHSCRFVFLPFYFHYTMLVFLLSPICSRLSF